MSADPSSTGFVRRPERPVLFLAPMAGVTNSVFRRICKKRGADVLTTEFVSAEGILHRNERTGRYVEFTPEERPLGVQIFGGDPEQLARGAIAVAEWVNPDFIDINFGCPVKKVVNGHAGSALMRDEAKAAKILEATVKAVKLPVTLKMRKGWDETNQNAPRLARIAEECGIQMITVHGRTRCQLYNGIADWEFIRQVKDSVKLPVVVNGDIVTVEGAKSALEKSGADAVMVGRGAYGRPWFLRQVMEFLRSGEKLPSPAIQDQMNTILEHYQAMLSHYGNDTGLKIARKHLGWYSKGLPGSADFRTRIMQITDPKLAMESVRAFYEPLVGQVLPERAAPGADEREAA